MIKYANDNKCMGMEQETGKAMCEIQLQYKL